MVEILASLVSGSKVGGADLETGEQGQTLDIGHFFVALDPCRLAEGSGSFGAAVDLLADYLRSTPPIDPARPVLAPGDPEQQALAVRESTGIPLLPRLVEEIRSVARRSGAEVLI